jgi:3-phosphoshikimate 1-carboxyvinyltransferase
MGAVIVADLEDPPPAWDGGREASPTTRSGLAPSLDSEPAGELHVRAAPLQATTVVGEEVPLAIDELPLVALLGCYAEGETVVYGAGELRVKESDRIAGVVEGLRGLGADIEATEDGFAVRGGGGLRGGSFDPRGDHRLAMLGAVAGLASREGVEVRGMEAVEISYPGFEEDLRSLVEGEPEERG